MRKQPQKRTFKNRTKEGIFVFCALIPASLCYFIFTLIPTFNVFRLSFYEKGAYSQEETFVFLENFKTLFSDSRFIRSFQNTLLLMVGVTLFTLVLSLFYANLLTNERVKFNGFFRTVFYIPNILSVIVISGIFSAIYDADRGLLNTLFSFFSGKTVTILFKSEKNVIFSLIFALIWQAVGYYMVLYMSSISQIPKSIYESAKLDGVKRIRMFFQITLPLIWQNLRTTLTFFVISTVNMSFLFVKAMTSGGPNGASEVLLSFMYNQKDLGLYGYSMAAGVVIFLFTFLLAGAIEKVTRRENIEF